MHPTPVWELAISLVAGTAAIADDLRRRQIANWIPVFALISGLLLHSIDGGWRGAARSLGGAACGFGVFLVFYILGGMGGGDLKLMAGFGSILGPSRLWVAAWWTAVLGAVIALGAIWLVRKRGGDWRKAAIPYAPAMAAGTWMSLAGGIGG
jgi:prepilin peptidase CpaA